LRGLWPEPIIKGWTLTLAINVGGIRIWLGGTIVGTLGKQVTGNTERVRRLVQAAFDGHRIVIFSGGPKEASDDAAFDAARAARDGGGFRSIMGRNSIQRPKEHALKFLETIMKICAGELA